MEQPGVQWAKFLDEFDNEEKYCDGTSYSDLVTQMILQKVIDDNSGRPNDGLICTASPTQPSNQIHQ